MPPKFRVRWRRETGNDPQHDRTVGRPRDRIRDNLPRANCSDIRSTRHPPISTCSDSDAISAYIATLPLPALLFPLFAYFIGTFVGAYFAILIGQLKPIVFAGLVGLLVLTGTIANLIWIPHPLWFSIFAVIGIVASGWLASTAGPQIGTFLI